jgi:branched-chain amino acid transport system permease protein
MLMTAQSIFDQGIGWLRRHWKLTIFAVVVVFYPYIDIFIQRQSGYSLGGWTGSLVTVLMYAMLALGLNVVVGYAGLLDLGYAAFFAIGAYTMALFSSPSPPWQHPVPFPFNYFWVAMIIAAGIALFSGIVLGTPTIPLRGDYLAIVTLGFGEIVPVVFRNLTCVTIPFTPIKCFNLTAGEIGVSPIALPNVPFVGNFSKLDLAPWYYLAVLIIILAVFFNHRLEHSRLGRAWMAMREDEDAAAAMGVDIVRTKLLAFAMGATFSGFAGAYFASYIQGVFPSSFDFTVSVTVLCAVVLGGAGNPYGAIFGGLVVAGVDRIGLVFLTNMMRNVGANLPLIGGVDFNLWRYGLFGVALVVIMLIRPEGLIPSAARAREFAEAKQVEAISGPEAAEEEAAREGAAG